jgi:DNA-binding NtrC family response regulator
MDNAQAIERPHSDVPDRPPVPVSARRASVAPLMWEELREYHRRREAWEGELQRLLQARRELDARHWQLVLHAIEATTAAEEWETRTSLLPPLGEGPRFDERMALVERTLLDTALARTGGCRRRAAALLGLLPTTLCEKLKRLGGTDRAH